MDLGEHQQSPALSGMAGRPSQSPQTGRIIVGAKLIPGRMANLLFGTRKSETSPLKTRSELGFRPLGITAC
jgi:hypothetical protein